MARERRSSGKRRRIVEWIDSEEGKGKTPLTSNVDIPPSTKEEKERNRGEKGSPPKKKDLHRDRPNYEGGCQAGGSLPTWPGGEKQGGARCPDNGPNPRSGEH